MIGSRNPFVPQWEAAASGGEKSQFSKLNFYLSWGHQLIAWTFRNDKIKLFEQIFCELHNIFYEIVDPGNLKLKYWEIPQHQFKMLQNTQKLFDHHEIWLKYSWAIDWQKILHKFCQEVILN